MVYFATLDFRLHFTPTYSSWMNLVERWFAELTMARRGTHRSEPKSSNRRWALDQPMERRSQSLCLAQKQQTRSSIRSLPTVSESLTQRHSVELSPHRHCLTEEVHSDAGSKAAGRSPSKEIPHVATVHQMGRLKCCGNATGTGQRQDTRVNREPNQRRRSRRPTLDSNRHAGVGTGHMDIAAEMSLNYVVGVWQVLSFGTVSIRPSASDRWTPT